jgi:hypothetical protein
MALTPRQREVYDFVALFIEERGLRRRWPRSESGLGCDRRRLFTNCCRLLRLRA